LTQGFLIHTFGRLAAAFIYLKFYPLIRIIMKKSTRPLFVAILLVITGHQTLSQVIPHVISLHPENSNYLLYQGKPTILVTSGEHYGAVMNADFDYEKYLEALQNAQLNYTRIFIGPYSEMDDTTFGISNNTMNPKPKSWLTPWAKNPSSDKYDLSRWNDVFFERLKAFVSSARNKGIVVEITMFTSYYSVHQWSVSPFNPKNNIQGLETLSLKQVNTLDNGTLMGIQEKYVRQVIRELNTFGNVFFEIQNEPWSDNPKFSEKITEVDKLIHSQPWQRIVETSHSVSLAWQKKIAEIIVDEENGLPSKHLIAQNIANFRNKIENPDPNVSIFNFHYAYPEAASSNLGLKKAIGLDETGFMPHVDFLYRSQAWKFILAGGALYNNLDFSFTVGSEDGSHPIDDKTPGLGHAQYRKQLKIMKNFLDGFDFIRMKPDNSILQANKGQFVPFQVLAEPGKQYAIYLEKAVVHSILLAIPNGEYRVDWLDPVSGMTSKPEKIIARNGKAKLTCPEFAEDIALRIVRL
jgi:hypothetical protein|tara:strand:- start:78004 stop:79569 length:1566 start_codon:yes stop_codon:yes gene_type:complete